MRVYWNRPASASTGAVQRSLNFFHDPRNRRRPRDEHRQTLNVPSVSHQYVIKIVSKVTTYVPIEKDPALPALAPREGALAFSRPLQHPFYFLSFELLAFIVAFASPLRRVRVRLVPLSCLPHCRLPLPPTLLTPSSVASSSAASSPCSSSQSTS